MRLILIALLLLPALAHARTLEVGPTRSIALPSEAARVAQDGDEIRIDAGDYFDCAFWRANNLTITGTGPDTVLTDSTCGGKAIMVISGQNVTVRNLTLTRARVGEANGAGIRGEGGDLTIDNVGFINNQIGILVGSLPQAHIAIRNSRFDGNGGCDERTCRGSILVGEVARLEITNTSVTATKGGAALTTSAVDTILAGDSFTDGPLGKSSYLIDNNADGLLDLHDSVLQKGPLSTNTDAAIHVVGRWFGSRTLLLRNNRFTDDTGHNVAFLRNWSGSDAVMQNNSLTGTSRMQTSNGNIVHHLYWLALDTKAWLRHLAAMVFHLLVPTIRSLLSIAHLG
jgi:hypothetical protein